MTVRRLRGPTSADTVQRVILDGVEYGLRWRYLTLEQRWALDLTSAGGALLAGGIRVVQSFPLLRAERAGRPGDVFPPGELFVHDPRSTGRVDPGLDQMTEAQLEVIYIEAADLEGDA